MGNNIDIGTSRRSLSRLTRIRAGTCLGLAALAGWPALAAPPTPAPLPPADIPQAIMGAWQVRIDGRQARLKTDYTIEIKINETQRGLPAGLVSYFAGSQDKPSTICRSQLTPLAAEGQGMVFAESLNYRGGKDPCPVHAQVFVEASGDTVLVRWRDAARRGPEVKLQAIASRSTGGGECRLVSGDGKVGGQTWCRDREGNWTPRRS